VPARGAGQDRAAVFEHGEQLVVVLADGAGGTGDGARAAQAIVDAAGNATQDWSAFLDTLDTKLEGLFSKCGGRPQFWKDKLTGEIYPQSALTRNR